MVILRQYRNRFALLLTLGKYLNPAYQQKEVPPMFNSVIRQLTIMEKRHNRTRLTRLLNDKPNL